MISLQYLTNYEIIQRNVKTTFTVNLNNKVQFSLKLFIIQPFNNKARPKETF